MIVWHWDQGRLAYFEFDVLRRVAQYCVYNDFSIASRDELEAAIGLSFDAGSNAPWRNYARIFKSMFILSAQNGRAAPTAIAQRLAIPGEVTADEYFHFVVQATTEPSPALSGYSVSQPFRYPLLFALRYILSKAGQNLRFSSLNEIMGAYAASGLVGDEDDLAFIRLLHREEEFAAAAKLAPDALRRQARESLLRTVCQISYLHVQGSMIEASIDPLDAQDAFNDLTGYAARPVADGDEEIVRRASFFRDGSVLSFLDLPRTVVSDLAQAGFGEGRRVEKTHLVIERNARLRQEYFERFDPTVCDVCNLDTRASYPWTRAVLDLHHKLPLAAGTRVEAKGTVLTDLVPVCPTCHRAVHRFYDRWLSDQKLKDFSSNRQAFEVYDLVRSSFSGHCYAQH